MNEKSAAPALTRGLIILEIVAKEGTIGFNELKERMGLHATTLNRLIKVLTEKEYLLKNQDNKYTLGLQLLNLSNQETFWHSIIKKLDAGMRTINNKYGVSVLLADLSHDKGTIIYKILEASNLGMLEVGDVHTDLINFPWGVLYIAEQDKTKQEAIISKGFDNNVRNMNSVDRKDIDNLINEAVNEGYVDDKALFFSGRRFAVPIHLPNGKLIGALCSGSNKENLKDISIYNLLQDMKKVVSQLDI